MEAALKPAGIFEATNLATRAGGVLPNSLSGSAVTPKSLRGTSSGLSGRDLNSLWRSLTSSFWSVDFPAGSMSQTGLVIRGRQGFSTSTQVFD